MGWHPTNALGEPNQGLERCDDLSLGAADVDDHSSRLEGGNSTLQDLGELAHGSGQDDQVAPGDAGAGVQRGFVGGAAVAGGLETGLTVADADHAAGEPALLQGQAEAAADQAHSDNSHLVPGRHVRGQGLGSRRLGPRLVAPL